MTNLSREVLMTLLPDGSAWTPASGDDYDLLLDGIADNSDAVRADMEKLGSLRDPAKTPILSDLEKEYAIVPVSNATDAERRQRLAAAMFKKNTPPTHEALEEKLQDAGFDVHVFPNDPPVDPSAFITQNFYMTCGDFLPSGNAAQCGEPEAYCAQSGGELVVNGEIFRQYPNYTMVCAAFPDSAQCGEPDAQCGQFNSIKMVPVEYNIPTNPGYWPLIFFVGGAQGLAANFNSGAQGWIYAMAQDTDGKTIIGGDFTSYKSISRNRIARINIDGSLDLTFDPGAGADAVIYGIGIQVDGKIIIAGIFTSYNGVARNKIARLNTDGTLDATYTPGAGASHAIYTLALQGDDKAIIGGLFTSYDGTGRNRIARVNTDGSLDATFDPGTGCDNEVDSISIQTDDKILIGGQFNNYDGTARAKIARVETDGSLDVTLDPGTGLVGYCEDMAIQADGKIVIGGYFSSYNGTARNKIARVNTDGTLDGTFNPGTGASNNVYALAIQADGKIIVGGFFSSFNGFPHKNILRLNDDGSIDGTFDAGQGANSGVWKIIIQTDDKIMLGGQFTYYRSVPRYSIVLALPDASVDTGFNYDTSVGFATVPIARRQEFRRIILKYKPMHSWAAAVVIYS